MRAILYLKFVLIFFSQKQINIKTAQKMLVKLLTKEIILRQI